MKNRSGCVSVQPLQKQNGKNRLIKSMGSAFEEKDIAVLMAKVRQELQRLIGQRELFISGRDALVEGFVSQLSNAQVRTVVPELVFGKVYVYYSTSSFLIQL